MVGLGEFGFVELGVDFVYAVEVGFVLGELSDQGFQLGSLERGCLAEDPCGDAGFDMLVGEWLEVIGHGD